MEAAKDFNSIDFYFQDEKVSSAFRVNYRTISFFSLGNDDASKARETTQKVYQINEFKIELMNVLEKNEIIALAIESGLSEKIGKFIFTVFGGSARMLSVFIGSYKRSEPEPDAINENNYSNLPWIF